MSVVRKLSDFADIRAKVTGGWVGILLALGIKVIPRRHMPCPGCGGTDRFRFDDRDGRGTWICSGGGSAVVAGDGFELVRHVRGCSPLEALRAVAEVTGNHVATTRQLVPQKPAERPIGQRIKALRMCSAADQTDAAVTNHPYAIAKGLCHSYAARCCGDLLVIPIRVHGTGNVIAVQTIDPSGRKLTYGGMTAPDGTPGYLVLGNELDPLAPRYTCEGWATGVAIAFTMLRGNAAVAIAFGKSRMRTVGEQFQKDAPPGRTVLLAEDNDGQC